MQMIFNMKKENIIENYMPGDEITKFGFISHMEDYIKQLLKTPKLAKVDDYLLSHGIDSPKALSLLIKRTDPSDETSAILIATKKIKPEKLSEEDIANGIKPKDKFHIKYKLLRKNYMSKMKNLYNSLYENHIVNNQKLNEDGEGATSADASGQFITPLMAKKPISRTIYLTKEQYEYLKEAVEMDTAFGDFGYDAPPFEKEKDPAYDHKNMIEKGKNNGKGELKR